MAPAQPPTPDNQQLPPAKGNASPEDGIANNGTTTCGSRAAATLAAAAHPGEDHDRSSLEFFHRSQKPWVRSLIGLDSCTHECVH